MSQDQLIGHNYLAALAADIRALHASVRRSAEQAARDAIEASKLLIEAKRALPHGQWETWLREQATISLRTARRYMRIAASGLKPDTVADLGIAAAARGITDQQVTIARIRRLIREERAAMTEIGRHFSAVHYELGEERFRTWVPAKTGFDPDEALLLAEIARVTDAGGDVRAVLARDGVPKEICLPPPTEAEIAALRERFTGLAEADAEDA